MNHINLKKITYKLVALLFLIQTTSTQASQNNGEDKLKLGKEAIAASVVELVTYNASRSKIADEKFTRLVLDINNVLNKDLNGQSPEDKNKISVLDFSYNYLTMKGATELLKWIKEHKGSDFKKIVKCDLSFNKIYAPKDDETNKNFEEALMSILTSEVCVKITGNPISNTHWVSRFEMHWIASGFKVKENESDRNKQEEHAKKVEQSIQQYLHYTSDDKDDE